MKKKVLALSIAAMIGGVAHAGVAIEVAVAAAPSATTSVISATTATELRVSADGVGHVLLVPYFTTNNGNSTLLSLVNTDNDNAKAVKVRFRSAANSDDIFDFQVYMSPGDVWTANVSQAADGRSQLTTNDKSCTLPFVVNKPFVVDRLPASLSAAEKNRWTREGYVEIFNMADIVNDTGSTVDLFAAVEHVNGVAPCESGKFDWKKLEKDVTTGGANPWDAPANGINFRAPTSGLMGGWTVINVEGASVAWSGNMTALRAVGGANNTGRIVFSPQMGTTAATPNNFTSDPLFRTANAAGNISGAIKGAAGAGAVAIPAANFDLPDLSTPYVTNAALAVAVGAAEPGAQANAVATAIAVKSVINEYLTDTAIAAGTDWTFSMPTRRYAVAMNYDSTAADKRIYSDSSAFFTSANTTAAGADLLVCTKTDTNAISSRDREERKPAGSGFVISPGAITTLSFCGEVSVLSFNSTDVLGASIARKTIDATYRDGWMAIDTVTSQVSALGLPILGSSFVKATGPLVAGKSTNFGLTNGHRFTR